jgi:hypothetical protein
MPVTDCYRRRGTAVTEHSERNRVPRSIKARRIEVAGAPLAKAALCQPIETVLGKCAQSYLGTGRHP